MFDSDVYLVGASGGVYALLAAHLANVLLNYNNMEFGIVRLIGIFIIGGYNIYIIHIYMRKIRDYVISHNGLTIE